MEHGGEGGIFKTTQRINFCGIISCPIPYAICYYLLEASFLQNIETFYKILQDF
jgi:hypothetical protein